jgi:hypothetical protein
MSDLKMGKLSIGFRGSQTPDRTIEILHTSVNKTERAFLSNAKRATVIAQSYLN